MKNEKLDQMLFDILDATYLKRDGDYFYGEMYADYRDEIDDDGIKKIMQDNNPKDKFYELLWDAYQDCSWEYEKEVIDDIEKKIEEDIWDDNEDYIRDFVTEHVMFNIPEDHYLNQDVCVDIIVDAGDGNYDFTKNELFGCVYTDRGMNESSSLIWLIKQQGYSDKQIIDFIENENYNGSKLLESIHIECVNTTTCMNALTFFVKCTLQECIELNEKIGDRKDGDDVFILSKDTPCGLYDPWNGAGSVLEIELEKDVKLPYKFIDSAMPDGCRGYSVVDIYGMCRSFWG